jgi:4-hydroxy-tetrahydrodipicolinate synthase
MLGFASLAECQHYPVNAKYHMQLEGADIGLFSRVQDHSVLTQSRRMEIEQLRSSVAAFRSEVIQGH